MIYVYKIMTGLDDVLQLDDELNSGMTSSSSARQLARQICRPVRG